MTDKFKSLGIAILIGLSAYSLTSCHLFFDRFSPPPAEEVGVYFKNASSKEVIFEIIPNGNKMVLKPGERQRDRNFRLVEAPVVYYLSASRFLRNKITLSSEGVVKKEWKGPPGHFGDSVNSPYNYDAWSSEKVSLREKAMYSTHESQRIIFTVTDADLK